MTYKLPHTIQNEGEALTFLEVITEPDGDRLIADNVVKPGGGPPMHTHYLQEEGLTVLTGRIGYQIKGKAPQFADPGETVVFPAGVTHKWWNASDVEMRCTGYVKPAHSFVFFLSSVYAAQQKSGSPRPDMFDASYLLTRYASEYEMNEIPWFVRKIIMPVTYMVGRIMNKYTHFKDAPAPVKTKK